jgi:hypothetical protein
MVLALHVAALVLLLAGSRTLKIAESPEHPIALIALPRVEPAKVVAENNLPRRLSTDISVALAPPSPNPSMPSDTSIQSGTSSAPDGRGSGVNWIAEAHRAVRAYEIRRNQTSNSALSVSSSLDELGFREHHAGDQMKTAAGDWIVWINDDCYQVAGWRSNATASGALSPQTICRNPAARPHGD